MSSVAPESRSCILIPAQHRYHVGHFIHRFGSDPYFHAIGSFQDLQDAISYCDGEDMTLSVYDHNKRKIVWAE